MSRLRRLIVLDLLLLAASVGVYVARFPIEDDNPDATSLLPVAFFAGIALAAALVVLLVLAVVLRVRGRRRPSRSGRRG